jgi:hypothetical protein
VQYVPGVEDDGAVTGSGGTAKSPERVYQSESQFSTHKNVAKQITCAQSTRMVTGMHERHCDAGRPCVGPYVIYAKASAGSEVPTHWHPADGELIWISSTGRFKMKDTGDQTVKPGMFVRVPSKHAHSERCITVCSFYAVGDQAFDIHYINARNEIPFERARAPKKH